MNYELAKDWAQPKGITTACRLPPAKRYGGFAFGEIVAKIVVISPIT